MSISDASPIRSTATLASAPSSSRLAPGPHHSDSLCPSTSRSSPSRTRDRKKEAGVVTGVSALSPISGVCRRRDANPLAVIMSLPSGGKALAVAWTIPFDDAPKLVPVYRAEFPVLSLLVVLEREIRKREVDRLGLRDGEIHKTLT